MPADLLTDTAIRKAKPGEKPRKLADGKGLYLELQPSGARWWRLKYRIDGKEKRLSLGVYPEVPLAEARRRRDAARQHLANKVDPSDVRKEEAGRLQRRRQDLQREAEGLPPLDSFEHVAREWLEKVHMPKVSDGYAARSRKQLEADVFPWVGRKRIGDITAPMMLDLLRKIEARGAQDTAHRVKQTCGLVFRYGIASGACDRDPTADLREALAQPVTKHYAAVADPKKLGELLRAIEGYGGHPATRVALMLAVIVFQRPGNVVAMRWRDLDLDAGEWAIPSAQMKRTKAAKLNGAEHLVPLAKQAVEALRQLQPLTGAGEYCFPNQRSRSRPISNVTVNAAMRRMGFSSDEITAHGFRSTARTIMAEQLPEIDTEWIEVQLAHGKSGPLGAAYDRAQYMAQRRHMMQVWADYLDRLREGAQVLSLGRAA